MGTMNNAATNVLSNGITGEVVTWDVEGTVVPYARFLDALGNAGLEKSVARSLCFSNAFRRAIRSLTEGRIIRKVEQDTEFVRFQFTSEEKDAHEARLNYSLETIVAINKSTGEVSCDDPAVKARAEAALAEQLGSRNAGDVSRAVFKLFSSEDRAHLDLVPLRKAGGTYFVRAEGSEFLDSVESFLSDLGCRLNRYPIANVGDNRSVREAVAAKMFDLIEELNEGIADFSAATRDSTKEATGARVQMLRYKIESYAEYLDDQKADLLESLADADRRLRERLVALMAETAEPELASV